ncbi:MAG: GatB/YqeY domain-containing protein [Bacilli bacterium]|nr:GatB/YqeY domain-containing protein [Bacilli bacterium]
MNEKIKQDLILAMKSKEEIKLATLRLLKGAVQIEEKKIMKPLDDNQIIDIISKQIKLRKESIEEFKKANRLDAIETLNKEIEVLLSYLPEQISNEELEQIIDDSIKEVNAISSKDFGNVMKVLMPKIKSKADTKLASEILKSKLN